KKQELRPQLDAYLEKVYQNMYLPLARDALVDQLNLDAKIGRDIAPFIAELAADTKGDCGKIVDEAIEGSMCSSRDHIEAYVESNAEPEGVTEDVLVRLSNDLFRKYKAKTEEEIDLAEKLSRASGL